MDLFAEQHERHRTGAQPLAARMRPRCLDEFVGQQSFLGPGKLLRRMLEADRVSSALFYGPPGTGKTSLAHIIANTIDAHFEPMHAAGAGVKEIRRVLSAANTRLDTQSRRTILFVDELHRFSRSQQDVLLHDVEAGVVILMGATTENPFFSINSPLISRSQIFQFEALSADDIKLLLHRAINDAERGLGTRRVVLTDDAADHLAIACDGDARRALTALEIAVLSQVEPREGEAEREGQGQGERAGEVLVDLRTAADSIQRKALDYDARGDAHYDTISALIKAIRGSDPDAAVYWLARMLEAGEDPRFIARRIVISAAEDIGNADPRGLLVAQAAAEATQFIGLPECRLPLAQAAIYLACAPKSNASAVAIWEATDDVRTARTLPVPKHLRSRGSVGSEVPAGGAAGRYRHEGSEGIVSHDYLGVDKVYYTPSDRGAEARIRDYLALARREAHGSTHD